MLSLIPRKRGSRARGSAPWVSSSACLATGYARIHAPRIGRSFPIWQRRSCPRHPAGEAHWRLSSIASDRCNVFGSCPTGARTLRLDTPEAMPSTFASPLNAHWGVECATPAVETGFLEGLLHRRPNTPTATRPTHRHPEDRTSPGPPSCLCASSITPVQSPVGSGGRCPTVFEARGLDSLAKVFGRPTNLMTLYRRVLYSPRGR